MIRYIILSKEIGEPLKKTSYSFKTRNQAENKKIELFKEHKDLMFFIDIEEVLK